MRNISENYIHSRCRPANKRYLLSTYQCPKFHFGLHYRSFLNFVMCVSVLIIGIHKHVRYGNKESQSFCSKH